MGPGCPVCITDMPEVDEGVALARQGVVIATYGDMLKVPGTVQSLADAQAEGAEIDVVYSAAQAVELARADRGGRLLRDRLRDDRRGHGRRRAAAILPRELLGPLGAQVHPARHGDRGGDAGDARRGLPRRRPRRRRSPAGASSSASSSATGFRSSSRASSRSTSWRAWSSWSSSSATATPRVVNMFPRCVTPRGQPPRAGGALERLPAGRRALARHRPRPQRQPAPARRVGARGRAPALHDRPARPLGLRAAGARRELHLRRHHVGHRLAGRLHALRQGVRARHARGRLHGLERGHLQDLAPVRRASRTWEARLWKLAVRVRGTRHAEAGRRRPRDARADRGGLPRRICRRCRSDGDRRCARWTTARRSGSGDRWLVVTTDSHVVHPIFFPGGDIGRLADLRHGQRPRDDGRHGGARADLRGRSSRRASRAPTSSAFRRSIRETCREAGATIVTGDTKVMGRGELDGIVLNTTGVGLTDASCPTPDCGRATASSSPARSATTASPSWPRATGSSSKASSRSDVAPINGLVRAALAPAGGGDRRDEGPDPRRPLLGAPRDGGEERRRHRPRGAACRSPTRCAPAAEMLGIDPLHVANEGKAVLGVRPGGRRRACSRRCARTRWAGTRRSWGRASRERPGAVILDTGFGRRLLAEPEGEPLPRIC